MFKQKFQIGDKVALVKQPYTIGTVVDISTIYTSQFYWTGECKQKSRKHYTIQLEDNTFLHNLKSNELQFADLHALVDHTNKVHSLPKLSKKEKEEIEATGPYGYVPNFAKEEEKLCNCNKLYKENIKQEKIKEEPIGKCKYCGTPFNEIEESQEEPGACEYCVERRGLISKVVGRKSAYVDLHKFSGLANNGDWIEVTEWTNREGFDIMIHYASDHDEDDRTFKMSYEELEAVMNIVNKFGMLPPVYTKEQEN